LAEVETRHAERFAVELARAGVELPAFVPSWRTRLLLALARWLGTVSVLPRIALLERADARGYRLDDPDLAPYEEERANAQWLAEFAAFEAGEAMKRLILRGRRFVIAVVGAVLFTASVLLARNAQLEGLVFGLVGGVLVGPVTHYLLGKVVVPFGAGRVWCGWACWTAAVLDQLPYRASPGWLRPPARRIRLVTFGATIALASLLALGLGYGGGAVGAHAAAWFVAGNALYWLAGIVLAVRLRDNRAFCKYACPVAVVLRLTSRPALVKVAGDASACAECRSKACVTQCPMDIDVAGYVASGQRLLSSECIMCQHCVAVCPPNTLSLSVGFDLGGEERLRERVAA
jgi:ferredoxin-type protein NapH